MRIETGVSRDGCNAGNIMRAAKKYGLDCHGFRKEPDELRTIRTPCVIHWNFNHFVVFEGFRADGAYLNDPAVGRRKLTPEELDEGFTGIVLTFEPTDKFVKSPPPKKLLGFVRARLRGQYAALFKLLYIGLLLVFPGLALPVLSQIFMDDVLLAGNRDWFTGLLFFMAASIALSAALTYYRAKVLRRLQNKLVLLSGRAFLSRLFRLPIAFFDQRYAGDLSKRFEDSNGISTFLAGSLAETALNIIVAAFYLILLLIYNVRLTLIGLVGVGINLALVKYTSRRISDITMKLQQDNGKYYGALVAGLSISATLKASGAENEYVSRVIGYNAKAFKLEQRLSRYQQIAGAIPGSLGRVSDVAVLIVGALFVIRGNMTIGMLFAFSSLLDSFTEPVNGLVGFIEKIQGLKANMNRVEDILSYETDAKFSGAPTLPDKVSKLSGAVELDSISFGYSSLEKPLIEDFGFTLKTGQSVAFVGKSGCGKSTVSKVVSGLYSPWSGELRLDGVPVSLLPNEVLNASIATVSQNITLFSGSIRDNLTLWNRSVLMSDIVAAAKDACIHDIITQKPGAYDYRLEEGGSNFSGGQRQRLEIARALALGPSILIMDEATSALDPPLEKRIIDNIKRRGCTCIIVAHRLSAIRDCDEIIVMERGKIVQRGNHEALSAIDGHYRDFIKNT
jgi:NHLM bacteriocin system ABC transporter peptidase/ATP-binding protein